MRNDVILRSLGLGLAAALVLSACGSEQPDGGSSDTPAGGNVTPPSHAPDFESGQGQPEKGTSAYPTGPYGIGTGSIITNYAFVGFANAQKVNDSMQEIQLSDFYNPHADDAGYAPEDAAHDDRLFPPGSPYGEGTKKPKALLIDVASVWCGPCNQEAKSVLPGLHAKYKPCGGEFLLQLADGPTPGKPATPTHLSNWTTKYTVDYPATIDPTYKIGALFDENAFPANMIIDTRTMTIVEVIAGVPDKAFWTKYEKVINDQACLSGQ